MVTFCRRAAKYARRHGERVWWWVGFLGDALGFFSRFAFAANQPLAKKDTGSGERFHRSTLFS